MRSLILTLSYLLKDTWLRWFEQPGGVLARVLVTVVMTSLSILLLVILSLQIKKLEAEVERFGLDNIVVMETIGPTLVDQNLEQNRFEYLKEWGDLVILERLPRVAYGGGKRVNVMTYGESTLPALEPYLKSGHNNFLLSSEFPEGALIDFELEGHYLKAVSLEPSSQLSQVLPGSMLFVPSKAFRNLTERGFTRINYLRKDAEAPSLEEITQAVEHSVSTDRRTGNVEVKSALSLTRKIEEMKKQLNQSTIGLAIALGGALALIYGTLSILEFRQSMYISALLNSFGASKFILYLRTVLENLLVANLTAVLLIYALEQNHSVVFEKLKMNIAVSERFISNAYWGNETLWLIMFINVGVILSSLPILMAMRRPVGKVLN